MDRNSNTPESDKNATPLRIVQAPESELADEAQVDIEAQRKQVIEQAEAEEFWAGRNLAARISTRKAA